MNLSRSTWPRWARIVSSPWLVSPLLVIALLVGGFAGYGAWTRSQPTHYARGGAFHVRNGTGTTPAAGSAATPAAVGSPTRKVDPPGATAAAPSATAAAAAVAQSGRAGDGATTGQSTAGGHAAAPAGPTLTQPATGTYQLSVSGSEHVKFGPFSACTNNFPTSSALVVTHASGEPSSSYDFDQSFYPGSPNKHDERHIYGYTANRVVLNYEEATVTCSGVKQSTTVNYSPAQTRVQLPLSVGATWHSSGGDNSRTEDATAKIVGTDRLTVGGRSYVVYVIDTHVTMTGSESGTRDQRWWWSPALGIPLKWSETLSGSRSGATYSASYTCTITSLP